jgi:hypothetical protein
MIFDNLVELADLFILLGDQDRAVAIVSRLAVHPTSGPSVVARAQRIMETVDGSSVTAVNLDLIGLPDAVDLDELISLALQPWPAQPLRSGTAHGV